MRQGSAVVDPLTRRRGARWRKLVRPAGSLVIVTAAVNPLTANVFESDERGGPTKRNAPSLRPCTRAGRDGWVRVGRLLDTRGSRSGRTDCQCRRSSNSGRCRAVGRRETQRRNGSRCRRIRAVPGELDTDANRPAGGGVDQRSVRARAISPADCRPVLTRLRRNVPPVMTCAIAGRMRPGPRSRGRAGLKSQPVPTAATGIERRVESGRSTTVTVIRTATTKSAAIAG